MRVDLLDARGLHLDPTETAKYINPVVEIRPITDPKKEETVNRWEDIAPRVQRSVENGVNIAVIDNSSRNMRNYKIKDGYGIYAIKGDGEELKQRITFNPTHRCVDKRVISRTADGVDLCDRYYRTLVFTLHPAVCKYYIADNGLDLNHVIIDQAGEQRVEFCSQFYEACSKSFNNAHRKFVKRFGLYGVPVSSFDINRLEDLYLSRGVEDDKIEDILLEGTVDDVLNNRNTYSYMYRRLLTWVYYIQYHTDGSKEVYKRFYDWCISEYGVDNMTLDDFKNKITSYNIL